MSGKLLHLEQVGDLGNHAADRRRILQFPRAPDLVQPQPDQRLLLAGLAPGGGGGLSDAHLRHWRLRHWPVPPPVARHPGAGTAPTPSCRDVSRPSAGWRISAGPRRPPPPHPVRPPLAPRPPDPAAPARAAPPRRPAIRRSPPPPPNQRRI